MWTLHGFPLLQGRTQPSFLPGTQAPPHLSRLQSPALCLSHDGARVFSTSLTNGSSTATASASLLWFQSLGFPLGLPLPLSVHMFPRPQGRTPTQGDWGRAWIKTCWLLGKRWLVFVPDFGAGIYLLLLRTAHSSVRTWPQRRNCLRHGL